MKRTSYDWGVPNSSGADDTRVIAYDLHVADRILCRNTPKIKVEVIVIQLWTARNVRRIGDGAVLQVLPVAIHETVAVVRLR